MNARVIIQEATDIMHRIERRNTGQINVGSRSYIAIDPDQALETQNLMLRQTAANTRHLQIHWGTGQGLAVRNRQ